VPVGLEPFEDLLAVVQHGGGRIELERRIGLDAVTGPPGGAGEGNASHVVGAHLPEPWCGQDAAAFVLRPRMGVAPEGEPGGAAPCLVRCESRCCIHGPSACWTRGAGPAAPGTDVRGAPGTGARDAGGCGWDGAGCA